MDPIKTEDGQWVVVDPFGRVASLPAEALAKAMIDGYRFATPEESHSQYLRNEYGNRPAAAAALGAARALTFGVSDVVANAVGEGEAVREIGQREPGASIAGELPVYAASLGAAGAVNAAGRTVGEAVGGRLAGAAARAGAEGAIIGGQQTITQEALSKDPFNAEAALSHFASNVLTGGVTGVALGTLAHGLQVHAGAAKARVQTYVERMELESSTAAKAKAAWGEPGPGGDFSPKAKYTPRGAGEAPPPGGFAEGEGDYNPGATYEPRGPFDSGEAKAAMRDRGVSPFNPKATYTPRGAGEAPPPGVPSWREFTSGKMGDYMASEGGHAGAMKRLSEEYQGLKSGGGAKAATPARSWPEGGDYNPAASYEPSGAPVAQPRIGDTQPPIGEARAWRRGGQVEPPPLRAAEPARPMRTPQQVEREMMAAQVELSKVEAGLEKVYSNKLAKEVGKGAGEKTLPPLPLTEAQQAFRARFKRQTLTGLEPEEGLSWSDIQAPELPPLSKAEARAARKAGAYERGSQDLTQPLGAVHVPPTPEPPPSLAAAVGGRKMPSRAASRLEQLQVQHAQAVERVGNLRRELDGLAAPVRPGTMPGVLGDWQGNFAANAEAAARDVASVPGATFANAGYKVFISSAYDAAVARGFKGSLAEFKAGLAGNVKSGAVNLARVDLSAAADPDILARSAMSDRGADYHTIEIRDRQPKHGYGGKGGEQPSIPPGNKDSFIGQDSTLDGRAGRKAPDAGRKAPDLGDALRARFDKMNAQPFPWNKARPDYTMPDAPPSDMASGPAPSGFTLPSAAPSPPPAWLRRPEWPARRHVNLKGLGGHIAGAMGGGAGFALGGLVGHPFVGAGLGRWGARKAFNALAGDASPAVRAAVAKTAGLIADGAKAVVGFAPRVGAAAAVASRRDTVPKLSSPSEILKKVSFSGGVTDVKAPSVRDGVNRAGNTPIGKAFRARFNELAQAVTGLDAIRERVSDFMTGVKASDPEYAAQVADLAVKRIQYAWDTAPKNPGIGSAIDGYARWERGVPDAAIHTWARVLAALEDPVGRLLGEAKEGRLSPATVKTVKDVYPETFARVRTNIIQHLTELRETLSYGKRLTLSILFDLPVDSIMQPETVAALQATYTSEPNTAGGTQAPAAKLGSVKKMAPPEPTSAQSLSQ